MDKKLPNRNNYVNNGMKKMRLKQYLFEKDYKRYEFAEKAGITEKSLWNILRGQDIKLSLAMKIEEATEGLVTCQDLAQDIKKDGAQTKDEEKTDKE